jgi:2-methylcitrate dehydratase PrpD
LDIDDGHRRASGHPGAAVIPAVLAQAEALSVSGQDALAAIVIGYEIAVRAGAAFRLGPDDTISTGHWCSIGAAAAAGRVARLSRAQLASAIATAAAHAPRLVELGSEAHDVKEGIAWSTHAGVVAVELAKQGYSGPLEALDQATYRRDLLVDGLGRDRLLVETAYVKPYASCRWSHAAIDASLDVAREHAIRATDIESVTVDTFLRAASLFNETDPQTLEAAQYSIPYCVAAALVGGADALLPLRSDLLGAAEVIELARRVDVRVDPELDRQFPERVPARVTVHARQGTFTAVVETPRGDPANPLSEEELTAKFRRLTSLVVDQARVEELLAAVMALNSATSMEWLARLLVATEVPAGTPA